MTKLISGQEPYTYLVSIMFIYLVLSFIPQGLCSFINSNNKTK